MFDIIVKWIRICIMQREPDRLMGETMKYVLIALMILCCAALWAEDEFDSLVVQKKAGVGVCAYVEYGFGDFNGVSMRSVQAGLKVEMPPWIQLKGYGMVYLEAVGILDDPRYNFDGLGVSIGPVFHTDKYAVLPSIGLESGTIRIGEGEYVDGLLGDYYPSHRTKTILYVPVSLELQAHIGRVMMLSGRAFAALNSDYPVVGFCLGLGLGWM